MKKRSIWTALALSAAFALASIPDPKQPAPANRPAIEPILVEPDPIPVEPDPIPVEPDPIPVEPEPPLDLMPPAPAIEQTVLPLPPIETVQPCPRRCPPRRPLLRALFGR